MPVDIPVSALSGSTVARHSNRQCLSYLVVLRSQPGLVFGRPFFCSIHHSPVRHRSSLQFGSRSSSLRFFRSISTSRRPSFHSRSRFPRHIAQSRCPGRFVQPSARSSPHSVFPRLPLCRNDPTRGSPCSRPSSRLFRRASCGNTTSSIFSRLPCVLLWSRRSRDTLDIAPLARRSR